MNLINRARAFRKDPTFAETKLWSRLKREQLGVKFRRQQPIGPYIVDFFCPALRLIVEADGGQHAEGADQKRDAFLNQEGYCIKRYWNNDILGNIHGVIEDLMICVQNLKPPPDHASPDGLSMVDLPPKGGGVRRREGF